jgi:hypothetical protein
MKYLRLILLLSLPLTSYAQNRYELKGTTVLNGSDKNWKIRWEQGLWLRDIHASPCQGSEERMPKPKINSIVFSGDTAVSVDATINSNCCHAFLGELEVVEDSILSLTYIGYGSQCACDCCFGLTYVIDIDRSEDYSPDKLMYVMVNGMRETLKPINFRKK